MLHTISKLQTYQYIRHLQNVRQDNNACELADQLFPDNDCEQALSVISRWPDYQPTSLLSVDTVAHAANVRHLYYKDESSRFGLGSFKALGGSYAIQQLHEAHKQSEADQALIVCTATDGNHGRSVAWGAQLLGVECHIFIHAHVSENRAAKMAELGATIHRVNGNYDDSVAECTTVAQANGWKLVSDTSWDGYRDVPRQVMAGYSVMAHEVVQQLGDKKPSHIFIPAGCGGLAGAMIAWFWAHWKQELPTIIIVESDKSDCVYQSLQADDILLVDIAEETLMAGLSCGEVSQLAWPLLRSGVKHVITLSDDGVIPMMQWLADNQIEAGECSASCLMALLAISNDASLAKTIGIDETSTILVFGTEGATDLEFYQQHITTP